MSRSITLPTRQLPANFGPLKGANANARVLGPCGDTMEFWLVVENERIVQANFTTDGCMASIVSGAMAARLADGKRLDEACRLKPREIEEAVGGLPEDHKHCPVLALKALRAAIEQYRRPEGDSAVRPGQAGTPTAEETQASQLQPTQGNTPRAADPAGDALQERLGRIAFKLLVLSGKGGVGKSTVAANLAIALAARGKRVGLLDVDIHGPSIPKLLGLEGSVPGSQGATLQPIPGPSGLSVMSLGFLIDEASDAIIWRGPMKYQAIRELLGSVEWGDLDFLVVDSPPGTGDEPLAVAQLVGRPAAAVVVTTPQQVAVADVRRSVVFCEKVGLPVVGIVENMSGYVCPRCGETEPLFSMGGGEKLAREMKVRFLGGIPLDPQIVESGDVGQPFANRFSESSSARAFDQVVRGLLSGLEADKP
jgi:ATP-binding protein involved in chromosome partitioning